MNNKFIPVVIWTVSLLGCGSSNSQNTVSTDSDSSVQSSETSTETASETDDSESNPSDSQNETETTNPPMDELTGLEQPPEITWVRIEAGSFTYGSPNDTPCSGPYEKEVSVTLTRPFFMSSTELTQRQWETLDLKQSSWTAGENKPVTLVNVYEAMVWCNRLSRLEGLDPCYDLSRCTGEFGNGCINSEGTPFPGCGGGVSKYLCAEIRKYPDRYSCPGYRLPTAAEWEYAAKAGVTDTHTYGGDLVSEPISACNDQPSLNDIAWYCNNSEETVQDVAQKLPNPWGLFDTIGNIREWIDGFTGGTLDAETPDVPLTNPIGPDSGGSMWVKGYDFKSTGCLIRPSSASSQFLSDRGYLTGFRPVRTIFE